MLGQAIKEYFKDTKVALSLRGLHPLGPQKNTLDQIVCHEFPDVAFQDDFSHSQYIAPSGNLSNQRRILLHEEDAYALWPDFLDHLCKAFRYDGASPNKGSSMSKRRGVVINPRQSKSFTRADLYQQLIPKPWSFTESCSWRISVEKSRSIS